MIQVDIPASFCEEGIKKAIIIDYRIPIHDITTVVYIEFHRVTIPEAFLLEPIMVEHIKLIFNTFVFIEECSKGEVIRG